jgi:hypothetical protein
MDPIFSRFPLLYCCFNETKPFELTEPFPIIENKKAYIILGPVCQPLVDFIKNEIPRGNQNKIFWFSNCGEQDIGLKNESFFSDEDLILWDLIDPTSLAFVVAEKIKELDFQVLNFSDKIDDMWLEHFKKSLPILFYGFCEKSGKENVLKNIFFNAKCKKTFVNYEEKKGMFNNQPIFIVGAGPSYDVYKEQIKNLSSSWYIMGIGTGLRFLDQDQVDADFGVVIDPNIETYERLKQIKDPKILFSSLRTQKDFYQINSAPVALMPVLSMMGLDEFKKNFKECPILSHMPLEGCTTASMALQIAIFLGFSPIVMVGCDLEYKEKGYSGDIQSCWPQERFKPELAALKSQAKQTSHSFYRVSPGAEIEGFTTISGDLSKIFNRFDNKPDVRGLFEEASLNFSDYLEKMKASLENCEKAWDHPLKEVFLEDELAYQDVLKDFEISPQEFQKAIEL